MTHAILILPLLAAACLAQIGTDPFGSLGSIGTGFPNTNPTYPQTGNLFGSTNPLLSGGTGGFGGNTGFSPGGLGSLGGTQNQQQTRPREYKAFVFVFNFTHAVFC